MSSKIRVLRVVTVAECIPWHLDNTLKRIDTDFEVCVAGNGVTAYSMQYPNIKLVDISLARKVDLFSDIKSLIQIYRLMQEFKPHIVHSIMPKAGLLTAFAGFFSRVPVRIHTFTGQVWATKHGLPRFLLKALDKLVVKLNTLSMTDSRSQSIFLAEQGIRWKAKPLPFLSQGSLSGVDLGKFRRADLSHESAILAKQIGLQADDFVFAFLGRKTAEKGTLDLIKVFSKISARYQQARLLCIGPDESNGALTRCVDAMLTGRQQLVNIDRVKNPEVYLKMADVLCLPSYREGFGSVIIEAAAMGIPAIGSQIPGLVDAIQDGKTGSLVQLGDFESLEQTMANFIDNPEMVLRMGLAAQQRVDKYFSADILYTALVSIYKSQLAECRVL